MSNYKRYVEERTNKKILETDEGFAVYSFTDESVYIEEIYTNPDFRHSGVAAKMADKIALEAKEKGIKIMLGSVCPTAKGSTDSLKVLLAYGFEIDSSTNNFVVFKKEIL